MSTHRLRPHSTPPVTDRKVRFALVGCRRIAANYAASVRKRDDLAELATVCDGGAIFTDDDALAQAAREIRLHGEGARDRHTRAGVVGRMDTLQCAVVLAKPGRLDRELQRRRGIGSKRHADGCPNALAAADEVMSLPMSADLGDADFDRVVAALGVALA